MSCAYLYSECFKHDKVGNKFIEKLEGRVILGDLSLTE
jgi:hypothetical protein